MILSETLIARLQQAGKISWGRLDELLKESKGDSSEFCRLAVQYGHLEKHTAGMIIGDSLGCAYVDLSATLFQQATVMLLPVDVAKKYRAIAVYKMGPTVTVAMTNPTDSGTVMTLEKIVGCSVHAVLSFAEEIDVAIAVQYQSDDAIKTVASGVSLKDFASIDEEKLAELKPIIALSESIVLMALKDRASDIHIEPKKDECVVRFRVDGLLSTKVALPVHFQSPLIARYKIMANLDIAENRKPQDGRIAFAAGKKTIDIRMSTLPLIHGEKIVMRILGSPSDAVALDLEKLSLSQTNLECLKGMLHEANGIVFVTGPTGSGKSTTLYASLCTLDSPSVNIVTIEDPVEYEVRSLNQSSVDAKAGRTFQHILRSILRQDPDIVLVGEIRDEETARIAAQAALTGHLVLSSLHTNCALQAMTRLVDMGVEPHIVAPSVLGVVGQRLVRRICPSCKQAYKPDEALLRKHFSWSDDCVLPVLYSAKGCTDCQGTGYRGRLAIQEVFRVSQEVRECILGGKSYSELRAVVYRSGFRDMRFDGFQKAFMGLTTIEEVVRVTSSEQ